jgi:hypothetical protein
VALKLQALLSEFQGFGGHLAEPLILLLGICLLWPVRESLKGRAWAKPEVLEQLAIAAAFLVVYIGLPRELAYSAFIDVRALPVLMIFLIFAVLHMPDARGAGREFGTVPVIALAMLLTLGNFAYLAFHVGRNNAWMERYRAVARALPAGARVLPIYAGRQGTAVPYLHAGSFVLLDRGSLSPYLFAGDHGDPMVYFRFKHRPYRPAEDWYDAQRVRDVLAGGKGIRSPAEANALGVPLGESRWYESTPLPDWQRIACDYDYLLVTEPFEKDRLGLATRTVASNQSAALLRIDPTAQRCVRRADAGSGPN